MPDLGDLKDSEIRDQVLAARDESVQARRIKDGWARRAWDAYNNTHDWSHKEDWQSKIALPKWAMAIDQATNFMRQSLARSQRLFGIEVLNRDPVDKILATFFGAILNERVRQMNLKKQFVGGLKVALVTNQGIQKIGWDERMQVELAPFREEVQVDMFDDANRIIGSRDSVRFGTREVERIVAGPTAPIIDPIRYYPDPRGVGLYKIHESIQDLDWVLQKFEGVATEKVLRELKDDKADGRFTGDERQDADERSRAEINRPENAFRRQIKLTEYWGPLMDKDGKTVARRVVVTLANDKHLLRRGDTYPFWDGDDPFVEYQALVVPFSVWGKLLYQHTGDIQFYTNELASLMMDKAKMGALGMAEIDMTLVEDIEDILTGFFPGKLFKMRGPNGIRELDMTGVGTDTFQMAGFLDREGQNSHGVTEFLQGQPTSRGRATATEVQEKTFQGAQFFDGILSEVNDGMEKVFEKLYFREMQFRTDWTDPAIVKIAQRFGMEQFLQEMENPVTRYNLMKRPFKFHAAGLNAAIRRSEILKNATDLLNVIGNLGPEFLQATGKNIDFGELFEKIINAFQMDDIIDRVSTDPSVIVPGDNEQPEANAPNLTEEGELPPELLQAVQQLAQGGSPTGPGAQ